MKPSSYSAQIIHGEYYPHIDGIRALAVLPVVLFHILASLCPGGFVGVDVFFVISGYLITGGILRDLKKDRFTIRNFYHRRIRRIMPAYFAMIAGVFATGCALYYAHPLIYLADSTIMGTLFSANIYFYLFGGDYFDPNVHGNPLLHLWSLSVEEQFYLFIPLLCAVIWKLRQRLVAPTLALFAVLSLSGAIYAVLHGKQNNAFYFLHYRAWELLVGSLLATLPAVASSVKGASPLEACTQYEGWHLFKRIFWINPENLDNPVKKQSVQGAVQLDQLLRKTLLASLGLLLVGLTYILISSKTPFPGLAAVPPVIGTALLIRYGQSGWVSRLLSWRPFVAIGKISYSLYLWHWPVTVFWKYAVYDQLYYFDYLGMFILSLLLAYLSWKFVELPVRTSPAWTLRRSFAFSASGIVLLVTLGSSCAYSKGWPNQLHVEANNYTSNEFPSRVMRMLVATKVRLGSVLGYNIEDPFRLSFGMGGNFNLGVSGKQPELLLVGDSHAGHLQCGLDALLRKEDRAGYAVSRSSTDMFNVQRTESQYMLEKLAQLPNVSCVILAERWDVYACKNTQLTVERVAEFAAYVKSMKKALFIVSDIPHYGYAPGDIAARMKIMMPRHLEPEWNDHQQSEREYARMQGEINRKLEDICKQTDAVFIPLHQALKQGDHYIAFDKQKGSPVPLYKDEHHLSNIGSLLAAQFIMTYLFPGVLRK